MQRKYRQMAAEGRSKGPRKTRKQIQQGRCAPAQRSITVPAHLGLDVLVPSCTRGRRAQNPAGKEGTAVSAQARPIAGHKATADPHAKKKRQRQGGKSDRPSYRYVRKERHRNPSQTLTVKSCTRQERPQRAVSLFTKLSCTSFQIK